MDFLNSSLLKINGIVSFSTRRVINNQTISSDGLSLMVYNPVYYAPREDIKIITQSLVLPYFKASFYGDYDVLTKNIIIE